MTSTTPAGGPGRRRGPLARLRRAAGVAPGGAGRPQAAGAPRRRSRAGRRIGAAVRLVLALVLAGGAYAAFAPGMSSAEDTPQLSTAAKEGKALFDRSCISCHGPNAQGVTDRGPSLIGVGSAAVEFQVGTGRMPLARQEAQADRKPPVFNADEVRQLGAYIQELGGGPQLPGDVTAMLKDANTSNGGELYRINCAACHGFGGGGGALSSGKYAPSLKQARPAEMYGAMLSGPQNMPVFGDNQLSPQEKADVIAYVVNLQEDRDPGGFNLGRFGPVTEGLAIFLVGMVALIFTALWIAGKS